MDYWSVVVLILEALIAGCVGAGIVKRVGVGRVAGWLRLDVRDGDQ